MLNCIFRRQCGFNWNTIFVDNQNTRHASVRLDPLYCFLGFVRRLKSTAKKDIEISHVDRIGWGVETMQVTQEFEQEVSRVVV